MEIFSLLNVFGAFVVTLMMIFYAIEERSSAYTMLFGITCLGTSIYGFAAGTWPFGIIEGVWAVIAFRKYLKLRTA